MAEGANPAEARSVLFIVRGDATVPSCRFRAFQFQGPLDAIGVKAGYVILERSRNPFKQLWFHLRLIPILRRYRVVIFQKLLEPWRLVFLKIFNPNLYYDFDDAMYLGKDGAKFAATVRAAPRVIAGNAILAERALRYNPRVEVIPTTVPVPAPSLETDGARPRFILSWIGTAANLPYLDPVVAVLADMRERGRDFELRVMTDRPHLVPSRPWILSLPWSREEEEREFRNCDVGLMPLPDTEWCAGKCACKALQYLSYGKPVITSPVGVNRELFAGAAFGRLAETAEDWKCAIEFYQNDLNLRERAGREGRAFVSERFAVEVWAKKLSDLIFSP